MYTEKEIASKTNKDLHGRRKRRTEKNYQKAHHPEKHWHRFSNEVACRINFSTCMGTVRTTSGLKSRPRVQSFIISNTDVFNDPNRRDRHRSSYVPVSLFCTRLYTTSARSFLVSWASGDTGKDHQSLSQNPGLEARGPTVENIILICLQLTKRALGVGGDSRELWRSQFRYVIVEVSQGTLQPRHRKTHSPAVSYPRPSASTSN